MSAESVLEQLSREVVAGERLSFVVRGTGAEAILALIAHVRQAERERDEARAIAKGLTDTARMIAREYGP